MERDSGVRRVLAAKTAATVFQWQQKWQQTFPVARRPPLIPRPIELRFLSVHSPINNLFRVGRNLMKAVYYRLYRDRAFTTWQEVTTGLNAA